MRSFCRTELGSTAVDGAEKIRLAIVTDFASLQLARRTPTELFYKITYLLMAVISLAPIWQGIAAVRAG